jgi:hypothetical protein
MKTHLCNCILTFNAGPQAFLDLHVPLDAGEEVCHTFFEGVAETMRPTLPVSLTTGTDLDEKIPKRQLLSFHEAQDNRLRKVSLCILGNQHEAPKWYNDCHGKLYFD